MGMFLVILGLGLFLVTALYPPAMIGGILLVIAGCALPK
jgi:hypothetical protein